MLTGLAAGVAAIVFHFLIQQIQVFMINDLAGFEPSTAEAAKDGSIQSSVINVWMILPVITIGGLITGLIVCFLAPEAEGSGADSAIDAFHNTRGIIPARVPIGAIAGYLTIGVLR